MMRVVGSSIYSTSRVEMVCVLFQQALDESQLSNSGRHDALLDGLLIGTDADR